MHLRRVHIRNVRSIAELTWELPAEAPGPGWHVILGDNGSGKSSFLRSIALALVGDQQAGGLRQRWEDWLRAGEASAQIDLTYDIDADDEWHVDMHNPYPANLPMPAVLGIEIFRRRDGVSPRTTGSPFPGRCFSAAYGPFRRFTGGDAEHAATFANLPALGRHLSVFGESVALTEAITWLQTLKFKQLEKNDDGRLLKPIRTFVNQPGFLPHAVRLADVTSSDVEFVDANGARVPVQNLSDGYRSILSMTFELIRQMALVYGAEGLFSDDETQLIRSGVVIIDEIDAHLHPTWQRNVGVWFRKHFPNVQFIVSTHSPLICQAAEVGTVFRLPRPGDPDDRGEMVTGLALKRLLYGNVLDAYGTGVFGEGVTRSDTANEMLDQLAELNARELLGTLTPDEKEAQEELRDILPTDASTTQPS